MSAWFVAHEAVLRGTAFVSVFAAMAVAEVFLEARPLRVARRMRWLHNLGLTLVNTAALRVVFPLGAVSAALWSSRTGFGLFQLVEWHPAIEIVLSLVALDLIIYGQHVLFHAVPVLFRFHQVHHADVDFDVTLGTRFHPVEMALSMIIKFAAVAILGAGTAAVVLFETILAVASLFNHGNIRIAPALDRVLRWFIVTPAMHAIHHSAERADRDTNFGFNIPVWDRLFGTYRSVSAVASPAIGMPEHQENTRQTLRWMVMLPFRSFAERPDARRGQSHEEAA
jgi:sterol desaturase/sphingolipid hydroxylase (fatty acid hydroxylase superfamily)